MKKPAFIWLFFVLCYSAAFAQSPRGNFGVFADLYPLSGRAYKVGGTFAYSFNKPLALLVEGGLFGYDMSTTVSSKDQFGNQHVVHGNTHYLSAFHFTAGPSVRLSRRLSVDLRVGRSFGDDAYDRYYFWGPGFQLHYGKVKIRGTYLISDGPTFGLGLGYYFRK